MWLFGYKKRRAWEERLFEIEKKQIWELTREEHVFRLRVSLHKAFRLMTLTKYDELMADIIAESHHTVVQDLFDHFRQIDRMENDSAPMVH